MSWLPKRDKLDPVQAAAIDFAVAQEGNFYIKGERHGAFGGHSEPDGGADAVDDAAGGEKVRGGDVVRAEAEALPVGVDERGQAVESVLCPGDEFHFAVHYTKFGRPMGTGAVRFLTSRRTKGKAGASGWSGVRVDKARRIMI